MSVEQAKNYIAVVDDDESLCRSLSRLLTASGYHPISYLSAEAFLNDAKQPAFDCLVVDVQLGGMSGIDLNHYLAEVGVSTPVIFLTAHENSGTLERDLGVRCAAFLRKNAPGDVVLAAIERAIHAKSSG